MSPVTISIFFVVSLSTTLGEPISKRQHEEKHAHRQHHGQVKAHNTRHVGKKLGENDNQLPHATSNCPSSQATTGCPVCECNNDVTTASSTFSNPETSSTDAPTGGTKRHSHRGKKRGVLNKGHYKKHQKRHSFKSRHPKTKRDGNESQLPPVVSTPSTPSNTSGPEGCPPCICTTNPGFTTKVIPVLPSS